MYLRIQNVRELITNTKVFFLPASAGKAGIQGSSELVLVGVVTLLLAQHSKAYKSSVKHSKA